MGKQHVASRDEGLSFGRPYPWVFVDGGFVPADEARLSVLSNAVNYGTGTFEGIRACWNGRLGELFLLEARAHYERLGRSARVLGLKLPYSAADLVGITAELLRRNEVRGDAYIRPLYLVAGEQLALGMNTAAMRLIMPATPMPGDYIDTTGVRCMVSTWRRGHDNAIPNRAKVTGSYLGPSLAKSEAVRNGFDEAILLTADGFVAEATTSNIFVRHGDTWATPPGTDDILEGITRRQVIELLAEQYGTRAVERRVHRSELYTCDEALLCGTAVTVTPILEIDHRPIGPGPTTLGLQRALCAIARREDDRHPEWTTPVYDPQEETP